MTIYYSLYSIFVSIWILKDAPLRGVSRWWALGALILPLLVPYYFIKTRPLNRYWKLIALWLLGFLLVHAIGTVMLEVQTTSVPTSPNHAVSWKTFVSDDKDFTVQFPTEPNRKTHIVNAPYGKVKLIQYMSKHEDIVYAVAYGDYRSNAFVGMTSEQRLDNARNGFVEGLQGKLLSELIISKANYPGREITVKVEPNTVLTAQIILKDNRLYQVLVGTPSDKLFTSNRREFFNSFEILR